jgi:hypothetical protein
MGWRTLGRIRRRWGRDRRLAVAPGCTRQPRPQHCNERRWMPGRSRTPGDRCRAGQMNSQPRHHLRNRMDTGLEALSPPPLQRHSGARSCPSMRGLRNPRASRRRHPHVDCGRAFRRSRRYMERRRHRDRLRKSQSKAPALSRACRILQARSRMLAFRVFVAGKWGVRVAKNLADGIRGL